MNRIIKFRAWHKSTSTMFNVHGWHSEFVFEDTLNGCGTTETNPCKIEYCELMEFTGMYDQNLCEIYEGDIVKCTIGHYDEVIFNEGCFMLKRRNVSIHHFVDELNENVEVIGDIYRSADILTLE